MNEILTNVIDFIRPELVILIVVLMIIGMFIKKAPRIPDWSIPFILLAISIVLAILYIGAVLGEGFGLAVMVSAFIQGILIAGMAVFGNQLFKQVINAKNESNNISDGSGDEPDYNQKE